MPTLEENVNRVKAAKTAIGNAITAKGGTVASGDGLEDFAADIGTIPSGGGGSQPRKDVNFYDYDGTIVNSYSAADFANLSAMPSNPSHEGLTAQGWNWSLSDAKAYVATYGKLEIGQMYVTSDGKTRIYISLPEGRTSPYFSVRLGSNSEIDIDWGDESEHTIVSKTATSFIYERHNYATAGNYIITITVNAGSFTIMSDSSMRNSSSQLIYSGSNDALTPIYVNSIQAVYIGTSCYLDWSAFYKCRCLSKITMPKHISSLGNSCFNSSDLSIIIIPDLISELKGCANCNNLKAISLPNSITNIADYCCQNSYVLKNVIIPDSVTSIGNYAFSGTSANQTTLEGVIIPNSVTSIGEYAFDNNNLIVKYLIPNSVTSIGTNAFRNNGGLVTIIIDKPEGSISGSPWGATTSSPTSTQIIWTG